MLTLVCFYSQANTSTDTSALGAPAVSQRGTGKGGNLTKRSQPTIKPASDDIQRTSELAASVLSSQLGRRGAEPGRPCKQPGKTAMGTHACFSLPLSNPFPPSLFDLPGMFCSAGALRLYQCFCLLSFIALSSGLMAGSWRCSSPCWEGNLENYSRAP